MTILLDEGRKRAAVRSLYRVAGSELLAFNLVDSHIHIVLNCGRAKAGRIIQGFKVSLRKLADVTLDMAYYKAIEGRRHLENVASYVLRQDYRHETICNPALVSGSCFQDLVGARLIEHASLRFSQALPRYSRDEYCLMEDLSCAR